MILDELDKYSDMKGKTQSKHSRLSEEEKSKKLIKQGKAHALSAFRKNIQDT